MKIQMKLQKCIFVLSLFPHLRMSQEFDIHRDFWDYFNDNSTRKEFFYGDVVTPPIDAGEEKDQDELFIEQIDSAIDAVEKCDEGAEKTTKVIVRVDRKDVEIFNHMEQTLKNSSS